jgi:hypothetical protein
MSVAAFFYIPNSPHTAVVLQPLQQVQHITVTVVVKTGFPRGQTSPYFIKL